MILKFKIKLLDCSSIPATYRKNFVALIKEAFNNSEDEEIKNLNSSTKQKPFTFSTKFSIANHNNSKLELKDNIFEFYFSTNDYLIAMAVYNFMLKHLNTYNIFAGCKNLLIGKDLLKSGQITKDCAVFKTLSPILVRDINNGDRTLDYKDENFINSLKNSIKSMIKTFKNQDIDLDNIFIETLDMKSGVINSFGNNKTQYSVCGNSGLIKICTKSDYLQLLLDLGIGAKRSQGFGMVEKVL